MREAINGLSSAIYSRIPKPVGFPVKGPPADASPKHQQNNIASLDKTRAPQSTRGRTSANSLVYWGSLSNVHAVQSIYPPICFPFNRLPAFLRHWWLKAKEYSLQCECSAGSFGVAIGIVKSAAIKICFADPLLPTAKLLQIGCAVQNRLTISAPSREPFCSLQVAQLLDHAKTSLGYGSKMPVEDLWGRYLWCYKWSYWCGS